MKYEYLFFGPGSTEDIVATIPTDEQLPHIQVGHSLQLESDTYSTILGFHLEIQHVEVYLFAPVHAAPPQKIRIFVYTRERDRAALLERQDS